MMDWYSALGYANALSVRDGLTPCYSLTGCADAVAGWHDGAHDNCTEAVFVGPATCTGYRLPTEAEWEYAARAGTTTATYGGNLNESDDLLARPACVTLTGAGEFAVDTALGELAWYTCNADGRVQSVRRKAANPWALYDMLGNVWEWTWDAYSATAYAPDASPDPVSNETAAGHRVLRGGSVVDRALFVRASVRSNGVLGYRYFNVGLRLVRPR